MTDIRSINCHWPSRSRWARRVAYAAYAAVGVFAGLMAGLIARAA